MAPNWNHFLCDRKYLIFNPLTNLAQCINDLAYFWNCTVSFWVLVEEVMQWPTTFRDSG